MKRHGAIIILLFTIFLGIFFIFLSGKEAIPKKIDKFEIDRTDPEKLIEQFYNGEKNLDQAILKQFFYKLMSDTNTIKLKIRSFDIDKVSLNKVIKVEKLDRLAVISCSFKTFFNGIDVPRQDMEVINLIKEKDSWYIISNLDDAVGISEKDKQWFYDTEITQRSNMWNSLDAAEILDSQANFDDTNKERLKLGSIKLKQAIKGDTKK